MPSSTQTVKAPTSGAGHASPAPTFEDEPPQLVACLNMTPVDFPEGTTGAPTFPVHELDLTDVKSLEAILGYVDERMHGSLEDAWAGPQATDGEDQWVGDDAEEAWAKALSEILFGQRYGGPGQSYFGDGKWDSYIFSRFQRKSLNYMAIYTVRKNATPPATFLEAQMYKQKNEGWSGELQDNDDPAVSLCAACQHNSTYGVLSRGFTLEEHLSGAGWAAGQNNGRPIFDMPGGKWYPSAEATVDVEKALAKSPPIGPGTIYCFNPFGDAKQTTVYVPAEWLASGHGGDFTVKKDLIDNALNRKNEIKNGVNSKETIPTEDENARASTYKDANASMPDATTEEEAATRYNRAVVPVYGQRKGSHIYFLLRVSQEPIAGKPRIQLFNTSNGHPLNEHMFNTIMDPLGKEGIYDGIGIATAPANTSLVGLGVLPPAPVDLSDMALHMGKARPIGLLRMVLAERRPSRELTDRHILFASRLFRMYGDGETDNYWTSKCAWALRNTPGFTNIQPWWIIYIPRFELARMMWANGARMRKLSEMTTDVSIIRLLKFDRSQQGKPTKGTPPAAGLRYGEDYVAQIVITNDDKGNAVYWNRQRSDLGMGVTSESVQGNPLPTAIQDSVAPQPRQGRDPKLEVPWNGEHFDARYDDVDIDIPAMFRDEQAPEDAAEEDATPIVTDDERAESLRLAMIDDSDDSGDVEFADASTGVA